jgi:hypothetical protein
MGSFAEWGGYDGNHSKRAKPGCAGILLPILVGATAAVYSIVHVIT